MDKQELAEGLRTIADWIEQDSVDIKDAKTEFEAGHVEGVDPEDYQWTTHHPNGEHHISIDIKFYDENNDKSDEAFDPMDKIKTQTE